MKPGEDKYRLLFKADSQPNAVTGHGQCWREGGSEWATSAADAVDRCAGKTSTPTEGTWLALNESFLAWEEFIVKKRSTLDIVSTRPTAISDDE